MNALEKMQARNIYDDHKKLKSVQGNIVDYFSQFKIKIEEGWVRKAIEDSKVFIAGDALEMLSSNTTSTGISKENPFRFHCRFPKV